jgi:hypothetical protein
MEFYENGRMVYPVSLMSPILKVASKNLIWRCSWKTTVARPLTSFKISLDRSNNDVIMSRTKMYDVSEILIHVRFEAEVQP